jgi:hypothetical protein
MWRGVVDRCEIAQGSGRSRVEGGIGLWMPRVFGRLRVLEGPRQQSELDNESLAAIIQVRGVEGSQTNGARYKGGWCAALGGRDWDLQA